MTTNESIMEEMLDRATNPAKETVDELAVQMFCVVVRSNVQLVQKAQEMIVSKVRSSNIVEAKRAIALLEECMTQCGSDFQDEASKFRFLNELIRLVSKNYKGAETAIEIKQRIMECLLLWTTEFPQRKKIRDAYDMLRKEGDIKLQQTSVAVAKRKSVLDTYDEQVFAMLIKSKDPEDNKRANALLQYRIAQEARRNELISQHRSKLQELQNTMQLLNQMLNTYDPSNLDVNETIHLLYKNCRRHKPILQHMPELLGNSNPELVEESLDANMSLLATMERYNKLMPTRSQSTDAGGATTMTETVTEMSADAIARTSNNTQLLDDLLGGALLASANADVSKKDLFDETLAGCSTSVNNATAKTDTLADLSEIFRSALAEDESCKQVQSMNISELLEPQKLSAKSTASVGEGIVNGMSSSSVDSKKKNGTARDMPEIDMISNELFGQILPTKERASTFKRDPEKITLNDLTLKRMQVEPAVAEVSNPTPLDSLDDVPLLSGLPVKSEESGQLIIEVDATPTPLPVALSAIKHLSEISIDLDNVTPTGEQRVALDDNDLQLSLNFTEDRPSKHVAVIVISAQNKSREPVKDFQFDASVKKPCKVRLLPPTDSAMAPHKPFRPVAPINQVLLLLNPTGQPVDVTCIVGYKLGNDPDPIKESIVVKDIPFVK